MNTPGTSVEGTNRSPLRVLVVETDDQAVAPVAHALDQAFAPVHLHRVDSPATLSAALAAHDWQLLLCADGVEGLPVGAVLAYVRAADASTSRPFPVVVLSSSLDEADAVAAFTAGADGFVPHARLGRLCPSVERLLRVSCLAREHHNAREQGRVGERLAAVGTLASAVAHELNNPLAAVIANLELGLRDLDRATFTTAELEELRAELRDAHEAAFQLRQIVRDVKLLSRPQDDRRAPIDVRLVLEAVTRLLSNEIRHRARLRASYGVVPPVWASETRVGHALLDLVLHVAQGIAPGRADANEILLSIDTDPAGRARIEIVVKDTNALAPGTASGTAPLVLSVASCLVKQMGGQLDVVRSGSPGVRLVVLLPPAELPRRGEPAR